MDENGSVRGVILAGDQDVAGSVEWDPSPALLLPLANTPLVERILGAYARAGIRETLIAAGRHTREIALPCGDGSRWDMTLAYLACRDVQDGPGGQHPNERVREVAAFTKDAPFLITSGPFLLKSEVYESLIRSYRESRPVGIRAGRHAGITEENADRSAGFCLMTPRIYDALENVKTRDHTLASLFDSALDDLAARGETVLNRDLDHPPFSVGSPEAYLDSNERLLASGGASAGTSGGASDGASGGEKSGAPGGAPGGEEAEQPEIMDDNFSSPNLVLRPPVIVDATAELERCRIGPGVCIGPGVRIGHGAAIEHSVIMEDADIGDGASISRAVIGRNAGIENRATIHGRADRVRVVRSR